MTQLGEAHVPVRATLDKLDQDLAGAKGRLEGLLGGMGKMLGGVLVAGAAVGVAALATLGAAYVDVGVSSVKAASSLDQQMSNIAATMKMTKDEAQPLKDLIFDLSLNPNLTVDAQQAADAIEMLGKNGLTMTQIIGGAAESTVQLANATGADFGLAADVATDVMSLFNVEASQMGLAIDGITGVTTNSKFTIDDYALALGNAGGVAAGYGVDLADLNTVLVGTSSFFASGSEAGTSFKALLQRLSAPTKEVKAVMSELGISLFDQNGQMRDMSLVVDDLHNAFGGMSEAQQAATATALGGADASRMVLALAKMTGEEYTALNQTVNEQGQAAASAATRVDSLQGAWAIFLGIVDAIKIQMGDKLLPVVRTAVEAFSKFATEVGPEIVEGVGVAAEFFQSKLMPILLTMGENIIPMLREEWKVMGEAWRNQIQPALSGLIDSVRGVATALGISSSGGSAFQVILFMLKASFTALATVINIVTFALNVVSGVISGVVGVVTGFVDGIKSGISFLKDLGMTLITFIPNAIKKAISAIKQLSEDLVRMVLPKWLQPGSPTPLEIGLLGISQAARVAGGSVSKAFRNLPDLEAGFNEPHLMMQRAGAMAGAMAGAGQGGQISKAWNLTINSPEPPDINQKFEMLKAMGG